MAKVKVDFDNHSVPFVIEQGRNRVEDMTGNSSFPTPLPTLIAVTAAIDALEAAYLDAIDGDRVMKALMRDRKLELKLLTVQLAAYVQNVSAGDEAVILSSGFQVHKQRTPSTIPAQPVQLETLNANTTSIAARCKPVPGARTYMWIWSTDGVNFVPEAQAVTDTASSAVITGLNPSTKYYLRVKAINSAGSGEWSATMASATAFVL